MVNLSTLKNPLVIGIMALALTYLYMWWEEKKRREKNPKAKKRSVNIITPAIVGGIAWFVASNYFDTSPPSNTIEQLIKEDAHKALPGIVGGRKPILVKQNGITKKT